ncbi:MAG: hypothetical protein MJ252_07165 [archaeon]|nr:hypothetical protein [archaeon]
MGNEEIKKDNLNNSILDKNVEDLQNLNDEDLEKVLLQVYNKFREDPDTFEKLKKSDLAEMEKEKEKEREHLTDKEDKKENGEEEIPEEVKLTKSQKFRNIILSLLLRRFEDQKIYLMSLKLARCICDDDTFLKEFMETKYEDFCSFLSMINIWEFPYCYIQVCLFFNSIINHYMDSLELKLSTLSKMALLLNKVDGKGIYSAYDVIYAFTKLTKNMIKYAYLMYDKSKRKKASVQKDKADQIKSFLNDLSTKGILRVMAEQYFVMDSVMDDAYNNSVAEYQERCRLEEQRRKAKNKGKDLSLEEKKDPNAPFSMEDLVKQLEEDYLPFQRFKSQDEVDLGQSPHFLILDAFNLLVHIHFVFEERLIRDNNVIESLYGFFVKNLQIYSSNKIKKFEKEFIYSLGEKIMCVVINFYIYFFQNQTEDSSQTSLKFLSLKNENFTREVKEIFFLISDLTQKEADIFRPKEESESEINNSKNSEEVDLIYIENLKMALCLFFYCLCINRGIWKTFNDNGYVYTLNENIIIYIKRTFNFKGEIDDGRIRRIHNILNFLAFITCYKIHINIKHASLFHSLLPIVSLLFYINFPFFRIDVLKIFNTFVLYEGCKNLITEDKYLLVREELYKRIEGAFDGLKLSNSTAVTLGAQIYDINNRIKDIEDSVNSNSYESTIRLTKLNESLRITKSLYSTTKINFISQFNEFGLLLSIFVNLMIHKDYQEQIFKLCCNSQEKIENFFHFEDADAELLFVRNEEKDRMYIGKFFKFYNFFKYQCRFKDDLFNLDNNREKAYLKNHIIQILLAIFIHSPELNVLHDIVYEHEHQLNPETSNILILLELFRNNLEDYEMLQKILFALVQYYNKKVKDISKETMEITKAFLVEIRNVLQIRGLPQYTAREIFNFLISMLTERMNCILWMKMDNKKYLIDSVNNNEIAFESKKKLNESQFDTRNHSLLQKENENENNPLMPKEESKNEAAAKAVEKLIKLRKCIPLPFKRIEAFKGQYGVLLHDRHRFNLLKTLSLCEGNDHSYTISFLFYNPVLNSNRWHVLLQDDTGTVPIIAVDPQKKSIGCFDVNLNFLDSGIDLTKQALMNKWLHFAMVYDSITTDGKLKLSGSVKFYLNGVPVEKFEINQVNAGFKPCLRKCSSVLSFAGKEGFVNIGGLESSGAIGSIAIPVEEDVSHLKMVLPKTLKYIGNSEDYGCPFGAFCDLRVYLGVKKNSFIESILKYYEPKFQSEFQDMDFHKAILDELSDTIIFYCLKTDYVSEEVLHFLIHLLNILISRNDIRSKFMNFDLIVKIAKEGLCYNLQNKKEVTTLLKNIG